MATPSPLQPYYESIDAMMLPWGEGASIAGQCDMIELEYAAIRKAAAVMDGSHRGLLRLRGGERLDFLHRMVTQDCRAMKDGEVRRAFILTAKGRIMADLLIIHRDDQTLIETDIHQAAAVAVELEQLLFGEDVQIEDLSGTFHSAMLVGPAAVDVLQWWRDAAPPEAIDYPRQELGVTGMHIWAPAEALGRFAEKAQSLEEVFRLKFIGWMSWNMARIEAGRAMFNIDFGPDSLPHEAGPAVLAEAVSFTKGCYRGQEIVARMQSRGHPARILVGFRIEGEALPVAGVEVRADESADAPVVGAVTSSAMSPMLGNVPIGMAMVKWEHHEPGTRLYVPAEGRNVPMVVQEMMS